jgi:CubicO group peptidase (beta-lactamase class C family)
MTRKQPLAAALLAALTVCSDPASSLQGNYPPELEAAYAEAGRIAGIKSLLVASTDSLIAEGYFNGETPQSVHDVRSVTKSFTSALLGIAIREGFIESVDQTVGDYLTGIISDLPDDIGRLTIDDLLTMRSGQAWSDFTNASEFGSWIRAPDQLDYVVRRPLVDAPGTLFAYSDGTAHLAAAILQVATGRSALAFAEEHLFGPLGIGERQWLTDNRGYNLGGVGLIVTPRDMVAFGMLFLNEGVFEGHQLVPAQWVATSTTVHTSTNSAVPYGSHYGYYWWIGEAAGTELYMAMGWGGQFIVVVPTLDLVVVATCHWRVPEAQARQHWSEIIGVIAREVLPAVRR